MTYHLRSKLTWLLLALVIAAGALNIRHAKAQPYPLNSQGLQFNAWTPTGWASLAATSTTANVALGSAQTAANTPFVAWVQNVGANPANVLLGAANTVAATLTSGTYIAPGECVSLNALGATYLAAISTAGTTLNIMTGVGVPNGGCSAAQVTATISGGNITATNSASITNPSNTLATPALATAYGAATLICTSATAATCNTALASQYFQIANNNGGAYISRMRLSNNDTTSTSWGSASINIDLWTAAPTFTNGDRGAFAVATGALNHLGAYNCVMSAVGGDGTYAECAPAVGNFAAPALTGQNIYWTLEAVSASGTVNAASKTWTVKAETSN